METRHAKGRYSELPSDYTQMVGDVFAQNFEESLAVLKKDLGRKASFLVFGRIYANEIVLAVSLVTEKALGATTVYASSDFDPQASAPRADELLSLCVDAAGAVFQGLLGNPDPKALDAATAQSLATLENVPLEWSAVELDKRTLYVKLDKAHLALDRMADDWLKKNDPDARAELDEEEKAAEDLFVVSPQRRKP